MMDFKTAEAIKFYNQLLANPNASEDIIKLCNENLLRLLNKIQPEFIKMSSDLQL